MTFMCNGENTLFSYEPQRVLHTQVTFC